MSNDNAFPLYREGLADSTEWGLTKREYYAAMAMQGMLANSSLIDTVNWEWIADNSVQSADAIIKALNKE